MTKTSVILITVGAVALLLLIPTMSKAAILTTASDLIKGFESFSPTKYWDVSRYSWGYGTKWPGHGDVITREQAAKELQEHAQSDLLYLTPLITRPLRNNQWAALLSFAYNEGPGNADNLVRNINSGDDIALETQWKKYIYAGGRVSDTLVDRRNKEWRLWVS